ncbi:hypothetical protein GW17_00031800 [Ensete ventricosum]|nr:hypothetical protein GW17_00031800 [Ensete ventricosum]
MEVVDPPWSSRDDITWHRKKLKVIAWKASRTKKTSHTTKGHLTEGSTLSPLAPTIGEGSTPKGSARGTRHSPLAPKGG